jgi:hypothetical protein
MRYIQIHQGPNRAERRASSRQMRRMEKTNKNSKRMNRPHKMEIINSGYEKIQNSFFPV